MNQQYNNPQYNQYNQQYDPQQQQQPYQQQPQQYIDYNQQQMQHQQPQGQAQYDQNNNAQYQQPQQQQYQQNPQQQQQLNQYDSLTQFQQQQELQKQNQLQMDQYGAQPSQQQQQYQQQDYGQKLGKFQQAPDHQTMNEVDRQFAEQYGSYAQNNQPEELINNVKPRTRTEREAMRDKESIEKTRINNRVGYEARNINMRDLLHNPNPTSTLFIPENWRFDKDFAVYDKQVRETDLQKKEYLQEQKRVQGLERESRRWESIENQILSEQQKREYQSKVLLAGKRNCNGLPYNPITLQYDNSDQGRKLKAKDDDAKVRAYVRSENLDSRSNSGYNILTGDQRMGVEQLVPNHMKDNFETKLKQKQEFYSVKWQPDMQQ